MRGRPTVQITIRLPRHLLDEADRLVDDIEWKSRSHVVTVALSRLLNGNATLIIEDKEDEQKRIAAL